VAGLKLAGAAFIAAALGLVYWSLARLDLRWAWLWPFVLLLCGAPAAIRMIAVRPQGLTLGLLALLASFLVRGGPARIFAASLALSWIHLGLAWLAPVTALPVLAVKLIAERRLDWRMPAALLVGLIAGWLLRPHPVGAAQVLQVQLLALQQARADGVPLLYAAELSPRPLGDMARRFLPFLVLWVAGAAALAAALVRRVGRSTEAHAVLWTGLLLSAAAFVLCVAHSGRWMDFWRLFAVLFLAVTASPLLSAMRLPLRRAAAGAGAVLGLWMLWSVFGIQGLRELRSGYPPRRLEAAAGWLERHSPAGSLVFHARWAVFGELFFWNRHNRYVNGMDPIFLFARDERLYWKMHHLALGPGMVTAGFQRPARWTLEDTRVVLRRDFGADYLLVEKNLSPGLLRYAQYAPGLLRVYEDAESAVFEIVEPTTPDR
jgi:hypothetical protein